MGAGEATGVTGAAGTGAGTEPAAPIVANRAPTGTVESTATSMESKVPETGDGISVSTLSVETSNSASSALTESPTFFSQRVTVPSDTDSPKAGMTTTVPEPLDEGEGATGVTTGVAVGAGAAGVSTWGAGDCGATD